MFADLFRRHHWLEPGDDLSVPTNKEFGKVPADVSFTIGVGFGSFELVVEFAGAVAVHFYLGEKLEVGAVF